MKRWFALLGLILSSVLLLGASECPGDMKDPEVVVATVVEKRTAESTVIMAEGSAGEDALAGAVVGKVLLNSPATGALVGAAASDPGKTVVKREIKGCMCIMDIEGVKVKFFFDTYSPYLQRCALARLGDRLNIQRGMLVGSNPPATAYQWKPNPDGIYMSGEVVP